MQYLREYSILFDEYNYFVFYFSEPDIRRLFSRYSENVEDDLRSYYMVRAMAGKEIPLFLKPFFYQDGNNSAFFMVFTVQNIPLFEISLERLIVLIYDSQKLSQYFIKYFFEESGPLPSQEDIAAGRLPHFTRELHHPEEIKVYITYCIEHLAEVQKALEKLWRSFFPIIEKLHKDQAHLVADMEQRLSVPQNLQLLSAFCSGDVLLPETFVWGCSLLNIYSNFILNVPQAFMLGTKYYLDLESFHSLQNITIESYLEAMREEPRQKILDLLRKNGNMNCMELCSVLHIPSFVIQCHLDALMTECIIYISSINNTSYQYTINPEYYRVLSERYAELYQILKQEAEKRQQEKNAEDALNS